MAKLFFFKDKVTGKVRNTGVDAESASAAKAKLKRPPKERAVVAKVLTKSKVSKGWDRTRMDGKSPAKSAHGKGRGFGPPRK
jgi:hypothetical protein